MRQAIWPHAGNAERAVQHHPRVEIHHGTGILGQLASVIGAAGGIVGAIDFVQFEGDAGAEVGYEQTESSG